ncbi:hypothetical protein BH10PSE7_BH10PSE7_13850 [soil metagenome]
MRADTSASAPLEHRLAIMTNWAFFASFGFCFILSGFAGSEPIAGLAGFAAFVAGFIAHIIINRIFRVGFTSPQVALGLIVFTMSVIGFAASWIFDPSFSDADVLIGIVGFGAIMACFIVYIMINYGVRESYAMMHRLHRHERRGS